MDWRQDRVMGDRKGSAGDRKGAEETLKKKWTGYEKGFMGVDGRERVHGRDAGAEDLKTVMV